MSKNTVEITCYTPGCLKQWSMTEIIQKADMTKDEALFYNNKISLNALLQKEKDISECPKCGQFCQRQGKGENVRCISCRAFEFCWICKSPWSSNHACIKLRCDLENIQRILNTAPLKKLDYAEIKNVPSIRLCPKCGVLIQHAKMCKQVKCENCETEFCFSCLTVCVDKSLKCTGYQKKCNVSPVQKVNQSSTLT